MEVYTFPVVSNSVADGDYDFDMGSTRAGVDLFLDEFRFVDSSGVDVIPSAGSVSVQISSDGTFWRELNDGSFAATVDTKSSAYKPPSGLAAAKLIRVSLSGVVGASGFIATAVKG